MEIVYHGPENSKTAEIIAEGVIINDTQDMIDIMADCRYNGAGSIIIHKENLIPGFFDLKTRIAGDILQKFSNYRMQLAIIGDFTELKSKSLRDFIFESNKTGMINFVPGLDEALQAFSDNR